MTDWDQIVENIEKAMQAVDETQTASENLRNHTTAENFDEFRSQMEELCSHLSALKNTLEHESAFTLEELVDALSEVFSGKPAAYRKTPRIES